MYQIYDIVKVINKNNETIKEGAIIKLTTDGAFVYQEKCIKPFTDSVEFAEWFPFSCKELKMIKIRTQKNRNSV